MTIEIRESFRVTAEIDEVWRFLLDPDRLVVCIPGAELLERIDDATFNGSVRVKVGPIVVTYTGQARFEEINHSGHTIRVVGQGKEKGGSGAAKGVMTSSLVALEGGVTLVNLVARVDVTGRVMQLGARMLEGVTQQLLQQFIASVREQLETVPETGARPVVSKPIPFLSLLATVVWRSLVGLFRRLFGWVRR